MRETSMMGVAATAMAGMAIGAAAMYVATQDRRTIRRTVHKLSRGAEKALIDMDKAVEHYMR